MLSVIVLSTICTLWAAGPSFVSSPRASRECDMPILMLMYANMCSASYRTLGFWAKYLSINQLPIITQGLAVSNLKCELTYIMSSKVSWFIPVNNAQYSITISANQMYLFPLYRVWFTELIYITKIAEMQWYYNMYHSYKKLALGSLLCFYLTEVKET